MERPTPSSSKISEGSDDHSSKKRKTEEHGEKMLIDDEAASEDIGNIKIELLAEHFARDFKIAVKSHGDSSSSPQEPELPRHPLELELEIKMKKSYKMYGTYPNLTQNDIVQFKTYYHYIMRNITCTAVRCIKPITEIAYSTKQVYEKHSVCFECKGDHFKINHHTTHMINVLNKMLEDPLNFKCLFFKEGCDGKHVLPTRHELFCMYQKTSCIFPDCKWLISYKELKKHIEVYHNDAIVQTEKKTVMSLQFRVCFDERGQAFVLMRQYVNKDQFIIGYAVGLVTPDNITNHKFAITVELENGTKKTVIGQCICVKPYELAYESFILSQCEKNTITYENRGDFNNSSCTVVSVPYDELVRPS